MASAFSAYFRAALARAAISQRAFAIAVGAKQANVQQVAAGKRKPPLAQARAWARVLREAVDADEFEAAVHLAHATPLVQDLVTKLRKDLAAARVEQTPSDG